MTNEQDEKIMALALEQAQHAADRGEVPIGAVIVHSETGEILAANGNRTRELHDPSAHAEVLVIREACKKIGTQRIPECDLYVTLEPCTMCAGAISFARIRNLVIAADDPKGGAVINGVQFYEQRTCHHRPNILQGSHAEESSQTLRMFFKQRRQEMKKSSKVTEDE